MNCNTFYQADYSIFQLPAKCKCAWPIASLLAVYYGVHVLLAHGTRPARHPNRQLGFFQHYNSHRPPSQYLSLKIWKSLMEIRSKLTRW